MRKSNATPSGSRIATATRQVEDSRRGPRTAVPAQLVDAILGPELPGAACRGRAPMHDLDVEKETEQARVARHAQALAICAGCPAHAACRAALVDAPAAVVGVWAGEIHGLGGRPRKHAATA